MSAVSMEATGGRQIFLELGSKLKSSSGAVSALTSGPSLQPQLHQPCDYVTGYFKFTSGLTTLFTSAYSMSKLYKPIKNTAVLGLNLQISYNLGGEGPDAEYPLMKCMNPSPAAATSGCERKTGPHPCVAVWREVMMGQGWGCLQL